MPSFRTRPSQNLASSIRRLIASSGGVSPLNELQADALAAQTAHRTSLVEKVRAEVEAAKAAEARRNDPAVRTEYASHAAGINVDDGNRLMAHIRGTLEQPSVADVDDADRVGAEAQPFRTAAPEVGAGKDRLFRSALASAIANNLATGKTNAAQMAQAGDRVNETALTQQAALEPDLPTANRIVAAVAGKVREPFKVGPQGQVLNEETGNVNEGTRIARAAAALTGARTTTEGARQTELGTRSGLNTARQGTEGARARLASSRAAAVDRGDTGRAGQRITPQQVERWVSEVARKEWDTIPANQRKGMNYDQHLVKVRERFKPPGTNPGAQAEVTEAHEAIAKGADPVKVAKRFKERMGFDMPEPAAMEVEDAVDLLDDEED